MYFSLLGHGVVGTGVTTIIEEAGLEQLHLVSILVRNINGKQDERSTGDFQQIINDPEVEVIVECIGGDEPAYTYVKSALQHGMHVVSANKKMLARHLDLFDLAAERNLELKIEASCGGGIPWFHNLERLRRSDEISEFAGIMNGTCNFILDRMDNEELDFGQALKQAQQLGYAEADPADDILGYDTLYKLVLSIYKAFDLKADYRDIPCLGIDKITKTDIAYAKDHGFKLKLLAQASKDKDGLEAYVMPVMVKAESEFGIVKTNCNLLTCSSDHLGKASFFGQGAGSLPTGQAIIMDLLDLEESTETFVSKRMTAEAVLHNDKVKKFYIRQGDNIEIKECCLGELNKLFNGKDTFIAEIKDD